MKYENGAVYCIYPVNKDGEWIKGRWTYYDNTSSQMTEQGIEIPFLGKTGKWKIYRDGKYLRTDKYRYGFLTSELKDSSGRRILVYFNYGIIGGWRYECKERKFAMHFAPTGDCSFSKGIPRQAAIHNFFNDVRQVLRFGWHWRKRYESYECQDD